MNRREILKMAMLSTGIAVAPPFASAFLSACTPASELPENGLFVGKLQAIFLDVLDTILPKTDSPSATDVGVHRIIEDFVSNVYSEENREKTLADLNLLLSHLGFGFTSKSSEEKESILLQLGSSEEPREKNIKDTYLNLRQWTIALYLTTEPVMTQHLAYLPVPGEYDACVDIDPQTTKAWAL